MGETRYLGCYSLSNHPCCQTLSDYSSELRGTVVDVTATGVIIQTEYGEGTITVAFEDIEALSTNTPFHLILGDGDEVSARLLGVERGMLLVGDDSLDLSPLIESSPRVNFG